ncbi:hypothetical protein KPL47_09080 [Clostridium estertheticum]|uniref:hypothetical protein n=1 Tax=Clostridium estertheticum TaxID=238834 RepID=UPI001C0BBD77|nr:hypothetical protein [Clostridium estertheticum]MBU3176526.1 hypothetical protein [Clostridium estertheticum]
MVIRMFEYGFKKAKELSKYQEDDEKEIVIYIPKQLVIFVEQNRNIKDELKMKLVFPGGQEIKYAVPTMKYWEYRDIDIMKDKMYPLLPLQVFKLRYKMEQIKKKYGEVSSKIKEIIMEAKKISETISKEGSQLFNNAEIDGDDLHRILLAIANLFEYLNTKYGEDEKLNEEVRYMTKTLYDPTVEQRGIEKGIEQGDINAREEMVKEMLLDGESIVKIKKYSKLSEEEIIKIKNKITQ